MQMINKILSVVVVGGLLLSTAVSAQTVSKTGSHGGSVNKSATHVRGSTSGTATKTGPRGASATNSYSHTAGQGGSFSSVKTGRRGATSTTSGSKTVTPPPQ